MQSSLGSSTQYGIILFDFQAMSRPAVFIVVLVYAIVAGKDSFSLDLIISFHQSPAGQERDAGLVDTAETRNLVRREASPGRKNAKKVSRTRKSKKRTKKSKACKCKNGEERKKEIVQEGDTAVQFSELFFKNVQIHFKIEESSKYSESG